MLVSISGVYVKWKLCPPDNSVNQFSCEAKDFAPSLPFGRVSC